MRIDIYSALVLDVCLESKQWDGTFSSYLDATIPQWRGMETQRFVAYLNDAVWPQERWDEALAADAVVRLNLVPMGGIFKAIGSIIGKLFSFLGFGARSRPGNRETPESRELRAADGKANTAKLGGVVPELAGTYKRFPDYLTPPRRFFINKRQQWLQFLGCIGPGLYDVQPGNVRIGDTPFSAFGSDAAYGIYPPGVDLASVPAAEIWYTSPSVGSTSSGTAGLELTTEPANRVNVDPGTYTFSPSTITRSAGEYPAGWGAGTTIAVEYPVAYSIVDFTDPTYGVLSRFTGYFGHLPAVTVGTRVQVGVFGSTTEWEIHKIVASPGSGMYTLEFRLYPAGTVVRVTPGAAVTYIFGADIARTITILSPAVITVSPAGFETGVTKATRVRFVGGAVYGEWTNEFVATPDGSTTTLLELDVFFPQGLCYLEDDGDVVSRTVSVEFQYRDSVGGPSTSLIYAFSDATVDQIGFTQQVPITSMVPRVRARRVGAQGTSTQVQDKCQWYGLKAKLPAHNVYPNWSTMAVYMRSGGKLASQSENQINVIATRVLSTLQPDGTWGAPVATREISAFARHILNTAGIPDDQIDQEELLRLNAIWNARGETLDFIFDATTVKEALDVTFAAGMAEFTCGDGLVRPVREDVREPLAFEQSYSPHNMTQPLRRNISSHTEITDYDGVDVEYTDASTWVKETVACRFPGDLGLKVQRITLDGVTSRTRAWRFGMRRRGEQVYRRKEYSFATELDALNSVYKGYVALFDSYKQTALMEGIRSDGAGGAIVTCSEDLTWTPGASHIVGYRRLDGTFRGAWAATPGPASNELRAAIPTPWPSVSMSHELPHVYFGTDSDFAFPSLITGVTPRGQFDVGVTAVNYDPRVYAYDNAFPPA